MKTRFFLGGEITFLVSEIKSNRFLPPSHPHTSPPPFNHRISLFTFNITNTCTHTMHTHIYSLFLFLTPTTHTPPLLPLPSHPPTSPFIPWISKKKNTTGAKSQSQMYHTQGTKCVSGIYWCLSKLPTTLAWHQIPRSRVRLRPRTAIPLQMVVSKLVNY